MLYHIVAELHLIIGTSGTLAPAGKRQQKVYTAEKMRLQLAGTPHFFSTCYLLLFSVQPSHTA
jgi:hypothetical protein